MRKVRWGVLSTARIGSEKVIPAMQVGRHSEIVAIASRELARAKSAAMALNIPRAYASYEALIADPDIDAIYNPLPNHLHVPWSIKALEADKHVLCEKPIALTSAEAEQMLSAARLRPRLKVMEAFMYRCHPQWQRAKQLVLAGEIGELRTIQSFFSYYNDDPENIRNIAEFGGGALMDVGCYSVSLSRFIFDSEPQRVFGVLEHDPRFQTDRLTSGILDFGRGTSTFTCSTQLVPYQRVNIFGTEGRIEIEIPFNAPPDRPTRLWVDDGSSLFGAGIRTEEFAVCDQYTIQGDLFSRAILDNGPVAVSIEDALNNMRVIDAIVRSFESGRWEKP